MAAGAHGKCYLFLAYFEAPKIRTKKLFQSLDKTFRLGALANFYANDHFQFPEESP
jgi:hypothetical protein